MFPRNFLFAISLVFLSILFTINKMIAIVLLAILFLAGVFNTFFYIPPKKLLAYLHFLLPYDPTPASSTSIMAKSTIPTPKNKSGLEKVFSTFDKNGDGFITRQELGESLKSIGLFSSEKDVGSMIERLDVNGDGLIDLNEFCEMYEGAVKGREGEGEGEEEVELRDAFDIFDEDKDGLISVEELESVLSSLGLKKGIRVEDCKEMIKKVDMDGDGMVNFDEFKHMMKSGGNLITVS